MNEIRKSRPSFRGGDRPGSRADRPSSRGEKSSYRSSERPSFGGGSKFGSRGGSKFGGKPGFKSEFRSDKPSFRDGERTERPSFRGGERSEFRSERPFRGGDRPGFKGGNKFGDRPGFKSDRPSFRDGERSEFRSDRPSFRGGSKFGGKPGFKSEERGKFGKPFGGRKFEGRDEKPFGSRDDRRFAGKDDRRFEKRPVVTAPKPEREDDGTVRLNKFIANSGVCSRREADEFIQAGLVTVNGNVITELGVRVKRTDDIRFNGERMKGEKKVYILMNKPKDYVTTTSDPHAEKDVMQLISKEMCPERIFPVGRLDKATTGVLLLTNDGELTEKLTHPSYQKKKIYQVELDRNFHQDDMDKLVQGISLEDGVSFADEAAYVEGEKNIVGVEIHSGKNRIVRRMFEALGYNVRKLDRVYFAGLTKKNLRRGQWRFLSEEEVRMLKMNFYE